jgi:hypothetical protein
MQAQEMFQEAIPNWTAAPFWQPEAGQKGRAARRSTERAGLAPEGIEAAAAATAPLPFIAITPCRIMDTRNAGQTGAFGPPTLAADTSRDVPVPTHPVCTGIPATAGAYSLNITVTNTGNSPFGFLKVWPVGATEPNVSTLNWASGGVTIANAAIVPAGTAGAITVKVGNASADVIIDINGYYAGTLVTSLIAGTGVSVSSATGNVTVGIANGGVGLTQISSTGSTAGQALVSTGAAVAWGSPANATNFTGALAGEVTGTQGATVVSNAVSTNTANRIVRRDGSGNFSAGTITLAGDLDLTGGKLGQSGQTLLLTPGTSNTFLGTSAGNTSLTGSINTVMGDFALHNVAAGNNNLAIGGGSMSQTTDGSNNTALGTDTLNANIVGNNNTAVGNLALVLATGNNNTVLGNNAGLNTSSGSNNIFLGNNGGSNVTTGGNDILIGHVGVAAESNTTRIGTTQTKAFIAGVRGVTTGAADGLAVLIDSTGQLGTVSSSAAVKRDIADIDGEDSALLKLRPVSFLYRNDTVGIRQYGLIAEEVAKVMPELVQFSPEGQAQTVRYHFLAPLLLSEVQKQSQTIHELEHTIDSQRQQFEQTVNAQVEQLKALQARLEALEQKSDKEGARKD